MDYKYTIKYNGKTENTTGGTIGDKLVDCDQAIIVALSSDIYTQGHAIGIYIVEAVDENDKKRTFAVAVSRDRTTCEEYK